MTAPAEEGEFVEITSDLEDGVWSVGISLNDTTILIETTTEDIDTLPVLINSINTILETAWQPIEEQLNQEASP